MLEARPELCVELCPKSPDIQSSEFVAAMVEYMLTQRVGCVQLTMDGVGENNWGFCVTNFMSIVQAQLQLLPKEDQQLAKDYWKQNPWIFESTECRTCQKEAWDGWAHPCRNVTWNRVIREFQLRFGSVWPTIFTQRY